MKRKNAKAFPEKFSNLTTGEFSSFVKQCSSIFQHDLCLPEPSKYLVPLILPLIFSVTSSTYNKGAYVNSFFGCTERPWNFLQAEIFPLTYDLNGFKSRVNKHFFFGFFLHSSLEYSSFFCSSFSSNTMSCSGCLAL